MGAPAGTTKVSGTLLAPYVPSPEAIVDRMLDVARVGPGDTVYDLGSGDGRIVVAAAQRFGARALGFELDDQRFAMASARVRDLGLAPRAQIVHSDLVSVDLRPATVVTLYQLPSVNEMLRPALEQQLRSGARVVTHDFPINGWNATQVVSGRLDDGSQHAIYLYTVGASKKESAIMADKRTYTSDRASLELSGVPAGLFKSLEGGDAVGKVVGEEGELDKVVHKRISGVSYTDLSMTFGAGMSKVVYDWMTATLQGKYMRQDGSVMTADFNGVVRSRQDFLQGQISEIGFPACDAGGKDAAYITLKITPESTRAGSPSGKVSSAALTKVKPLLNSNFRLTIDGLDCTRVAKIDPIVVTQQLGPSKADGQLRVYSAEPGVLEVSNLVISLTDDPKNGFSDWFDKFVIKGNSSVPKNGTLEYLDPGMKNPIFTLTFHNLGIFKLARPKMEAGSEVIRLRAEMYCEQVFFEYGSSEAVQTSADPANSTATGAGDLQRTAPFSGANPLYVQPDVQSIADWKVSAAIAQNQVAARLARPLKFRG